MIPDTALYHEQSHTIMVIYAYMYMYKISHYTCNMCQSRRLQNRVLMQVGGTMLLKESLVLHVQMPGATCSDACRTCHIKAVHLSTDHRFGSHFFRFLGVHRCCLQTVNI